jgi:dolichyl-phosphate beta-glucosyltransferase
MASPVHLSIIIPAYNEAARILPSLEKINAFLKIQSYTAEVIVVDDCSRDRTYDLVRDFIANKTGYKLIRNLENLGKGASVKKGMLEAKGAYRLFSDADLSTPIDEVYKFLDLITTGGYDVVIGSRRVRGAVLDKRQPMYREASGRVFSVLVRMLTLKGFIDTQCGFKMFSAAMAEKVFPRQTIDGFGFDVEILTIAATVCRARVCEAPVRWKDSRETRVRLFRDSTKMFLDLLRIRFNLSRGVYR